MVESLKEIRVAGGAAAGRHYCHQEQHLLRTAGLEWPRNSQRE